MAPKPITVLCNGATLPINLKEKQNWKIARLEYDPIHGYTTNVNLRLADFVSDVLWAPRKMTRLA